ncbi:hypothetical protein JQ824_10835 [Brachyspira hyodysenteriae]|uniref:Uncharacterized protein n=1 Tax=Brachyspira hyodysenteriae (strain ATCC 49526 / WA1) TaxID=565034 RepID=A0A3B6V997_BRAHW|nr:hypothetical protein [Brachyspira hyodysenteriae]ACN83805.1 hypothetical protein BHWA1_01326 [Brachyspira hyodysenteriae WA1]MBT8720761.1 hypothetical protein [Brachyspira hyodysenteriae]MBT8731062.1 hypothetical protein [Brachyspira hyodysenteriae]MBT8736101.1 hypothetical protein [Brachyspira hyodysenteriae]MBT8738722.1 hypothetical protein [Brachyspira hyodysenteriae]
MGSINTCRDRVTLSIILYLEYLDIESEIPSKHIFEIKSSEFSIHSILSADNFDKSYNI